MEQLPQADLGFSICSFVKFAPGTEAFSAPFPAALAASSSLSSASSISFLPQLQFLHALRFGLAPASTFTSMVGTCMSSTSISSSIKSSSFSSSLQTSITFSRSTGGLDLSLGLLLLQFPPDPLLRSLLPLRLSRRERNHLRNFSVRRRNETGRQVLRHRRHLSLSNTCKPTQNYFPPCFGARLSLLFCSFRRASRKDVQHTLRVHKCLNFVE